MIPAVALFVVGIGFAAAWKWWLPDYRPSLRDGEVYGIDVSHHQGQIDWGKVREDRIHFAYVKATEGADHVDTQFTNNWRGAESAGVQRGAYHFFTLCSPGGEQAEHFLEIVPHDPEALSPALDLELAGNCKARPSKADVDREVRAFIDAVEAKTDRKVILYIGRDFEEQYRLSAELDRPLWKVRFARRPHGDWTIWQVGGFSQVDGIDGNVDLDVARPQDLR